MNFLLLNEDENFKQTENPEFAKELMKSLNEMLTWLDCLERAFIRKLRGVQKLNGRARSIHPNQIAQFQRQRWRFCCHLVTNW